MTDEQKQIFGLVKRIRIIFISLCSYPCMVLSTIAIHMLIAYSLYRGKVYVPKVEEVATKEYSSDEEEDNNQRSTANAVNVDDEYG